MIGPSGSGKTTALRAIAGFVRPSSGRMRIGGTTSPTCRLTSAASAWSCRIMRCFRICASPRMSLSACKRAQRAGADRASAWTMPAHGRHAEVPQPLSARIIAAASSSASRLRARSPCGRRCCCSTSRCRRSMRRSAKPWLMRSPACIADLPSLTVAVCHARPDRGADPCRTHRHPAGTERLVAIGPRRRCIARRPTVLRPSFWAAPISCRCGGGGSKRRRFCPRALWRTTLYRGRATRRLARACLLCIRPQTLTLVARARLVQQSDRAACAKCGGRANCTHLVARSRRHADAHGRAPTARPARSPARRSISFRARGRHADPGRSR